MRWHGLLSTAASAVATPIVEPASDEAVARGGDAVPSVMFARFVFNACLDTLTVGLDEIIIF